MSKGYGKAEVVWSGSNAELYASITYRCTSYVPIVLQQIGEGFSQIHLWPLPHAGLFTHSLRIDQLLPLVDHTE